jgi:hypothetical protein
MVEESAAYSELLTPNFKLNYRLLTPYSLLQTPD